MSRNKARGYLLYTNTRKLILALFLIVFVAFGTIGGCDNDGGGGPKPTPTPTATPQPTPTPTPPPPTPTPSGNFQPGDIIPGFVLSSMPEGSIADVRAEGFYTPDNSSWTVFFIRSLTTDDPEHDVQFDFSSSNNLYDFSIAYLDNTGVSGPISASAAVMATQDTAPYSLGNELSPADLKAVNETPSDCSEFTGDSLVTDPNDPSVVPEIELWAAWDEEDFYLCVIARDPNDVKDQLKQHWEFLGPSDTDWDRKSGIKNIMSSISAETGNFDEDRIAIWWDINAQGFDTLGCFSLCHDVRMQSINSDGMADLWHWKAARTNTAGFAEDQSLNSDKTKCPDNPCRQVDSFTKPIEFTNLENDEGTELPALMAENDPGANVFFLFDDVVPPDCPLVDCNLTVPFVQ